MEFEYGAWSQKKYLLSFEQGKQCVNRLFMHRERVLGEGEGREGSVCSLYLLHGASAPVPSLHVCGPVAPMLKTTILNQHTCSYNCIVTWNMLLLMHAL